MASKSYRVYFARTACGPEGTKLAPRLRDLFDAHGRELPVQNVQGDFFQVRELVRTGLVWSGTFAKLRDDAPNVISPAGDEREIDLEEGSWLIDKCFFLYRSRDDVLVLQYNRSIAGFSRFANYFSGLLDQVVTCQQVMNQDELNEVLERGIVELEYSYATPAVRDAQRPAWDQRTFDTMHTANAAKAKFSLRAPRGGFLSEVTKRWIRGMLQEQAYDRIKVKVDDETDPIALFMAPLKGRIQVELQGRYPIPRAVLEGLEEQYQLHRGYIPPLVQADGD